MPVPVIRSLFSDQVFRSIADDIVFGTYAPGDKLPSQRAIAASLGVNMATVREAIKRLEQLGLVEVRQGEAMRVADWRRDGGLDVVAHLLLAAGTIDREVLASVLEARRLMLAEAARLAAERRTDAQAERLTALAERMAQETGPGAAQMVDLAFMSELVNASGNLVFVLILNTVRRLYLEHAALFGAVVSTQEELSPLYRRAARAVSAGSATRAASATQELAGEQERRLLDALG